MYCIMNLIKLFFVLLANVSAFHLPIIDPVHVAPTVKQIIHTLPPETRADIVETVSGVLPKVDAFGHMVLTANHKLIAFTLHSGLTEEQKKSVILKIVECTMNGDEMGGKILLNYYNLINGIL